MDRAGRGHRAGRVSSPRSCNGAIRRQGRRQLDGDDRVGAGRQRRPGRDPDGGPGLDAGRGDAAGRHFADDPQRDRSVLGRRGHVGGPDRVAVHRAVVPRRQVGRGRDRDGQDEPQRGLGSMGLDGERTVKRAEHRGAGVLHRQERVAHDGSRRRRPSQATMLATITMTRPRANEVSSQNWIGNSWTSRSVAGSNR